MNTTNSKNIWNKPECKSLDINKITQTGSSPSDFEGVTFTGPSGLPDTGSFVPGGTGTSE